MQHADPMASKINGGGPRQCQITSDASRPISPRNLDLEETTENPSHKAGGKISKAWTDIKSASLCWTNKLDQMASDDDV